MDTTPRPLPALALAAGLLMALPRPAAAQEAVELPRRDRAVEPSLEEVFTVGTFDGAEWETFGEVRQVAFDGQGNLYVLDSQTSRMIVVDPTGEHVRTFGSRGEGPGEWRMPAGAAVLRDGRTVVADMGHRAYQIFGADGEYQASVPLGSGGLVVLGQLQPDPRGGAVFNGGGRTMISMESEGPGAPPQMPEGRPIRRVVVDGEPSSSVFYEAWQPPRPPARQMEAGGMAVMMAGPRAFEPRLLTGALPDGGMAVVDSSAYEVKILDPRGREVRRIVRGIEPRRVTGRIEEAEIQRQLDQLESGAGPRIRIAVDDGSGERELPEAQIRDMMRERIRNTGFYPEIPVARRMAAGWDGLLWLERGQVDPEAPGPIDLFTAAGDYRGTIPEDGVRIPDAFGPDGLVAFIETDDYGVATVEVKRLPGALR